MWQGRPRPATFPWRGIRTQDCNRPARVCQQTPPLNDAFLVEIAPSTASAPSVSFNTGKLNFGTQAVGSLTIPPQAVSVENTGDATLNISSITLTGANSADFSLQNPVACTSAPILPGSRCSFEIGFVPSIVGPEGAFVTLADDAPTGSQVLEAVGVGGGPLAVVTPLSVNLGTSPRELRAVRRNS